MPTLGVLAGHTRNPFKRGRASFFGEATVVGPTDSQALNAMTIAQSNWATQLSEDPVHAQRTYAGFRAATYDPSRYPASLSVYLNQMRGGHPGANVEASINASIAASRAKSYSPYQNDPPPTGMDPNLIAARDAGIEASREASREASAAASSAAASIAAAAVSDAGLTQPSFQPDPPMTNSDYAAQAAADAALANALATQSRPAGMDSAPADATTPGFQPDPPVTDASVTNVPVSSDPSSTAASTVVAPPVVAPAKHSILGLAAAGLAAYLFLKG